MKALKVLSAIIVVFVVVVVGGAVAFLAFADPNDFKDYIADSVRRETGRELILEGDLEWGFWPKIRLKAGPLSLSNAPGFGDGSFISVREVQVAVATLPLLSNRIEMDTVKLYGLQVSLAKNADGVTNWADLAGGEKEEKQAGDIAAVALGGVDIQEARISWHDASSDQQILIDKLTVSTGALTVGDPIELKLSAKMIANRPAVDGDVNLHGTIAYDLDEETYHVEPLGLEVVLRGKSMPGGQAALKSSAIVDIDLKAGIAAVNQLSLSGLGTQLTGKIEATDIESARPGARGKIEVTGEDLAAVFQALDLPAGAQLKKLSDRKFSFTTEFDANMNTGNVNVPVFNGRMLGATLDATLKAQGAHTDAPTATGKLNAKGPDLPSIITVLAQLQGMEADVLTALTNRLRSVKDKSFNVDSEFSADMGTGLVKVPAVKAKLLGATINLDFQAEHANTDKPIAKGNLQAAGPDLVSILAVLVVLQGMDSHSVDNLSAALKRAKDPSFDVKVRFDVDRGSGHINLPTLNARLLGNTISGNVTSFDAGGDKPAFKGKIDASGPDLPSLLAVAASFQGKDSGLSDTAKSLSTVPNKAFALNAGFEADFNRGRIDLPSLSAKGFGLTVSGKLQTENIEKDDGTIDGRLTIRGDQLGPLMTAFAQRDLGKAIRSLDAEIGIKGTVSDMTFSPFGVSAKVAPPGSKKPLDLKLDVGSARANLDKETLSIRGLTLTGLGINAKADVEATKIKSEPAFSGQLDVPTFNLRRAMTSLNKKLPPMADKTALTSVGMKARFKGTQTSLTLNQLVLNLDGASLKGDIAIADFDGPDISFGLGVDQFNADRYLPPESQGKVRPATPEAAAAGAAQLPVETLRKLKIKGDLLVGRLQISGAKMQNVKLSINAANGKIALKPIAAQLYNGSYNGVINLDATKKTPRLAINTQLAGVAVEPLLIDVAQSRDLAGTANLNANLTAVGNSTVALKKSLSGQARFSVTNGVYRGIDVANMLQQVEIMIESKRPAAISKGGQTQFQSLAGTLNIKNGVVSNNDLLLDGSGFKVTGKGMLANLHNDTMKYDARVSVDKSSAQRGESSYNLGGYSIPIRCRGKIGADACKPDVGDIVAEVAKATVEKEVQKQLNKQLEKAFGDKAGKALKDIFKF